MGAADGCCTGLGDAEGWVMQELQEDGCCRRVGAAGWMLQKDGCCRTGHAGGWVLHRDGYCTGMGIAQGWVLHGDGCCTGMAAAGGWGAAPTKPRSEMGNKSPPHPHTLQPGGTGGAAVPIPACPPRRWHSGPDLPFRMASPASPSTQSAALLLAPRPLIRHDSSIRAETPAKSFLV